MPLTSLPLELIHCITDHLLSSKDLNAFIRTDSIYYNAFNPLLYSRHIDQATRWAARNGSVRTLRKCLDFGIPSDVTKTTQRSKSLIVSAASGGHEGALRLLLERAADFRRLEIDINVNKEDALRIPIKKGYMSCLRLLLAQPDLNLNTIPKGLRQHPAISQACSSGNFEALQLLLDHGSTIKLNLDPLDHPLRCAAKGGNKAIVEFLLFEYGPGCSSDVPAAEAALEAAAAIGNTEIAQLLLDIDGVDVNRARSTRLPLGSAVEGMMKPESNADVLELLLKHGARVDLQDAEGNTPLHMAVMHFPRLRVDSKTGRPEQRTAELEVHARAMACIDTFLHRGADINALDSYRRTPLRRAMDAKDDELAMILLQRGADAGLLDSWDLRETADGMPNTLCALLDMRAWGPNGANKALECAACEVKSDMAKALLRRDDVDIEYGSDRGVSTPLSEAARYGRPNVVKLLLEHGANVNYRDKDGMSPLILNVDGMRRNEQVIKILVEAGADINAGNAVGRTAMFYAAWTTRRTYDYLLANGGDALMADDSGVTPESRLRDFKPDDDDSPYGREREPGNPHWNR